MGPQASTLAPNIDNIFMFITAIGVFFFTLITVLIVIFVQRYRRRSADEITPHITHNQTLEIVWSVLPLLILIGIFFWGFHGYVVAQIAPANAIEIQVTAKKWQWQFEYPDGLRTLNELSVPLNRPVRLVMNAEDVIHSFFVPGFRIKKDVLPEPIYGSMVSGDTARHLSRCFAPSTAARATRTCLRRSTFWMTQATRSGWSKVTSH